MRRIVLFSLAVAATLGVARAQNGGPEILVVPYAPGDPRLPYPAHEGARLTLKAMLRNANCAQGYRVVWDVNRNDTFDDDAARDVTPSAGSVYDIGRTFTVPAVDADSSTPINVRVTDRCTNQQSFASQRIFTYNWYPANDPRQWTAEQTEIMAQMALHEALWYLHRWTGNHAGQGAQITGSLTAGGNAAAGGAGRNEGAAGGPGGGVAAAGSTGAGGGPPNAERGIASIRTVAATSSCFGGGSGAAATRGWARIVITVSPMVISDPLRRGLSPTTRAPSTKVPLLEPRSRRMTVPSFASISAWVRLALASLRVTVQLRLRPRVLVPSSSVIVRSPSSSV